MKFSIAAIAVAALATAAPTAQENTLSKRTNIFALAANATGTFIDILNKVDQIAETAVQTKINTTVKTSNKFTSWKTYEANGVNLGGWLSLEKGIQPTFFNNNGASAAVDEDSFCRVPGSFKCGTLLENRYATWITKSDIDNFASYGVNTLRIPIGYWAFMNSVNGDKYHTGGQLAALSRIS